MRISNFRIPQQFPILIQNSRNCAYYVASSILNFLGRQWANFIDWSGIHRIPQIRAIIDQRYTAIENGQPLPEERTNLTPMSTTLGMSIYAWFANEAQALPEPSPGEFLLPIANKVTRYAFLPLIISSFQPSAGLFNYYQPGIIGYSLGQTLDDGFYGFRPRVESVPFHSAFICQGAAAAALTTTGASLRMILNPEKMLHANRVLYFAGAVVGSCPYIQKKILSLPGISKVNTSVTNALIALEGPFNRVRQATSHALWRTIGRVVILSGILPFIERELVRALSEDERAAEALRINKISVKQAQLQERIDNLVRLPTQNEETITYIDSLRKNLATLESLKRPRESLSDSFQRELGITLRNQTVITGATQLSSNLFTKLMGGIMRIILSPNALDTQYRMAPHIFNSSVQYLIDKGQLAMMNGNPLLQSSLFILKGGPKQTPIQLAYRASAAAIFIITGSQALATLLIFGCGIAENIKTVRDELEMTYNPPAVEPLPELGITKTLKKVKKGAKSLFNKIFTTAPSQEQLQEKDPSQPACVMIPDLSKRGLAALLDAPNPHILRRDMMMELKPISSSQQASFIMLKPQSALYQPQSVILYSSPLASRVEKFMTPERPLKEQPISSSNKELVIIEPMSSVLSRRDALVSSILLPKPLPLPCPCPYLNLAPALPLPLPCLTK